MNGRRLLAFRLAEKHVVHTNKGKQWGRWCLRERWIIYHMMSQSILRQSWKTTVLIGFNCTSKRKARVKEKERGKVRCALYWHCTHVTELMRRREIGGSFINERAWQWWRRESIRTEARIEFRIFWSLLISSFEFFHPNRRREKFFPGFYSMIK